MLPKLPKLLKPLYEQCNDIMSIRYIDQDEHEF